VPVTSASGGERRGRLSELQDHARGCRRCPQLAANRTTVVFGSGDPDADVLFVGESPGPNEDRQGVPFVAGPGRLLNELLLEVGLRREDVYVALALKCRPPSNRDPLAEELANCRSYLDEQVALVRPKVVVTLGNFATKLLREDPASIKAVRGRVEVRTLGARTVRLLPVHHPAAALYQRSHIALMREDLALLPALLALPEPAQPAPPPPTAEPPATAGAPAPGPTTAAGERPATGEPPSSGQLGLF
jgi:DNA polymerase